MIHSNSATRKIVDYIRAHPGATRPMMMSVLPDGTKPHTVSSILGHLAKGGVVQNLGRSGRAARWFPVTIEVDFKYRKMAIDLLRELRAFTTRSARTTWPSDSRSCSVARDRSLGQLKVLAFLETNPGATFFEIRNHLGSDYDRLQVRNLLTTLRYRHNIIENRGMSTKKGNQNQSDSEGRWYIKENPPLPFFEDAEEILTEMYSVKKAFRTEWLAKKLEEIFSEAQDRR